MGLPERLTGVAADDVARLIARDKKSAAGIARFVLLEGIGRPVAGAVVPPELQSEVISMALEPMNVLWLLHGVNMDMLGRRPAEHYGTITLSELCERVTAHARERGFEVRCFQTNHEGRLVEHRTLWPAGRAGRRRPHQPGGMDALQLCAPRRARARVVFGRRGPSLGDRGPRIMASVS